MTFEIFSGSILAFLAVIYVFINWQIKRDEGEDTKTATH